MDKIITLKLLGIQMFGNEFTYINQNFILSRFFTVIQLEDNYKKNNEIEIKFFKY